MRVSTSIRERLVGLIRERILVIDGAMGTMIQGYGLGEEDYRGERFRDHPQDVKGDNELLCLTKPAIIEEVHEAFLEAGCDIVETNTFGANAIAQADYGLVPISRELNQAAAEIARRAVDR